MYWGIRRGWGRGGVERVIWQLGLTCLAMIWKYRSVFVIFWLLRVSLDKFTFGSITSSIPRQGLWPFNPNGQYRRTLPVTSTEGRCFSTPSWFKKHHATHWGNNFHSLWNFFSSFRKGNYRLCTTLTRITLISFYTLSIYLDFCSATILRESDYDWTRQLTWQNR